MKQIITKGSPYQRGFQQGQSCKKFFENLKKSDTSLGCREKAVLKKKIQRVKEVYPQAIEELKGIADGLEMKEEYFNFVFSYIEQPENCSTASFFSENIVPMIAKTDDILKTELGRNIIEITYPDDGYKHIQFHFAGTIHTTSGMNECGFCFVMNGIPGPLAISGTDSGTALHQILPRCKSVDDAIELCKSQKINRYGYSIMIADTSDLVMIEKNSIGISVTKADKLQVLLHTNYILDEKLALKSPQQTEPILTNAKRRMMNMEHFFPDKARNIKTLREFVRNKSTEGSIWQSGQDGLYTDYAVIMNPRDMVIELYTGDYAENKVEVIDVFQKLK